MALWAPAIFFTATEAPAAFFSATFAAAGFFARAMAGMPFNALRPGCAHLPALLDAEELLSRDPLRRLSDLVLIAVFVACQVCDVKYLGLATGGRSRP
jgi:hypothetical protein